MKTKRIALLIFSIIVLSVMVILFINAEFFGRILWGFFIIAFLIGSLIVGATLPEINKNDNDNDNVNEKKEKIKSVQIDEPAADDVIEIHFPETFVCENNKYFAKYTYENILIVGYKYREPITDLKIGEDLFLELEPENEYDDKAVKVSVSREYGKHHIGYIAMNSALHDMAYDYLIANKRILAKLSSNDTENLLMHIVFYDSAHIYNDNDYLEIKKNNEPIGTFSTTIDDYYAKDAKIGDKVSFSYDYDYNYDNEDIFSEKDSYDDYAYKENLMIHFNKSDINDKKASKRVTEIIESINSPIAFIDNIKKLEDSKYKFTISIYDESKLI